ncbi:uncharacterized protein LOC135466530 [Liolophura sinensis]|uniref:uncharacterized protein LOC135466530 n=1 Tax=Liolophura sinensis TaxID=3198878 RepID=UPI0031581E02
MAKQMLKQAALSGMKSKDDLLDLKRINNQPLDKNSSNLSSLHMDNYLPFTPLGRKKTFSTSTPITHFAGDGTETSQINKFQIRNMENSDSEEETMEDESQGASDHSRSAPVQEHGYTKSLSHDTDTSSGKEADSETKASVFHSDQQSSRELEADSKDGLKLKPAADTDDKKSDSDTCSAPYETATGGSKTEETVSGPPEISTVSGDEGNKGQESAQTFKMTNDNACEMSVKSSVKQEELDPVIPTGGEGKVIEEHGKLQGEEKVTKTQVKGATSQASHEMECQTEEVSVEESSGEEDQEEKPEKKQKLDKDEEDIGGTTLTLLCESITKETLGQSCNEEDAGEDIEDEEDDDDDDEEEEEVERRKAKKQRKSNAGQNVVWKDEYGSNRELDGDPELLAVPFKHGWKRELVIRGIYEEYSKSGQPKRKPADVYYFTPEGTKLRSKIMIANYLLESGSEMTQANFSFIRRPIHKPPLEMVRQAGKSVGRGAGRRSSSMSRSPAKTPVVTNSPGRGGRKRKRGRPRKYEVIMMPPEKNLPPPEVVLEREGKEEPYEQPSPVSPVQVKPPSSTTVVVVPPKKVKAVARKSTTQAAKWNNQPVMRSPSDKPVGSSVDQLCGLDCPGRGGEPPDLQCAMCMCLFHPQCVNLPGLPRPAMFICRRCQSSGKIVTTTSPLATVQTVRNTSSPSSSWTVSSASPRMIIKNTNNKVTLITTPSASTAMPALRNCLNNTPPVPTAVMTNRAANAAGNVKTFLIPMSPQGANTVPLINSMGVSLIGPVAPVTVTSSPVPSVIKPPELTSHMPSGSVPTPPSGLIGALPKLTPAPIPKPPSGPTSMSSASHPQPPQLFKNGVSVFNLTKPTVSSPPASSIKDSTISVSNATLVTKTLKDPNKPGGGGGGEGGGGEVVTEDENKSTPAQLLTLPSAVVSRLNLKQPLALKINNVQVVAPPSCFMKSHDGVVKVCLPAHTIPLLAGTSSTLNMQVKVSGDSQNNSLKLVQADPSALDSLSKTDKAPDGSVPCKMDSRSTSKPKRNLKICHFRNLWSGYEAMQRIFTHLHVKDLLRVRCVCKTWDRLVRQLPMWEHLNLTGIYVRHWQKAVQFLNRVRTESLDFRKYDAQLVESELFPVLGELPLKQLQFGEVTTPFLHQVAISMTHLTHFSAQVRGESGRSLNFVKLSHLKVLRELKLYHSKKEMDGDEECLEGGQLKVSKFADLGCMRHLEVLVLKGIAGVRESDWSFLWKMNMLRELELSDCSSWKSAVYRALGQCQRLQVLKLSRGGTFPDTGMADALSNLTELRHLELRTWIIPHTLQDVLPELEHLHTLVLTPDTTSKAAVINRNTLSAVWDLSLLKNLKWGIKHSRDGTIILNNGSGEEGDSAASSVSQVKQTTQCIPFLADELSSDHIEPVDIDRMTQFISVEQLREKLHSLLPKTNIEVYLISCKQTSGEANMIKGGTGEVDQGKAGVSNVSGTKAGVSDVSGTKAGVSDVSGIKSGVSDVSGIKSGVSDVSGSQAGVSEISIIKTGVSENSVSKRHSQSGTDDGIEDMETEVSSVVSITPQDTSAVSYQDEPSLSGEDPARTA